MNFSVIIPLYRGKRYINRIINSFNKSERNNFEIIFINDFPGEKIDDDPYFIGNCKVQVFNNNLNSGIHYSRAKGIKKAKNEYILILDQDDFIGRSFFDSQIKKVLEYHADVVVANGFFYDNNMRKVKIYKNQLDLRRTNCLPFYFLYGNQIVSPGQCLIKKSSIPHEWLESKLDINGADDWLLWVMMLVKGKKFVMNDDYLYTHNNLEHNTSDDENKMIQSSNAALELFENKGYKISNYLFNAYKRKLKIRELVFKKGRIGKIIGYTLNPDLLLCLLYIKSVKII